MNKLKIVLGVMCVAITACVSTAIAPSYKWTQFVEVAGQPEPVPAEWVATPEGKFAHSIKIPNPVPKDSGYRPWMSSESYFKHLCETEAGEFIFKTVENVDGFYFMRPPKRPTDYDLKDLHKLEDPAIERIYQLRRENIEERAKIFVNPPWANFRFIEEPKSDTNQIRYRAFGYRQGSTPMHVITTTEASTRYGVIWRGLHRPQDRESRIAGSEMIVLDLKTQEILALRRNFVLSPRMRNVDTGIWWLNATSCGNFSKNDDRDSRFIYSFVSKVLRTAE